ncbi:MAG: isochorismatase family protein [Candidatus Thermoplasmatota archaeon]|jgi:nicotinamidase-related amidase|nr:isochorismatase family protein [Candidatus Thermoplasmatota archaeon]MCL5666050.1 isochorismatase family protein [Candidatus Thermoplasmatota archaeon]
MPIHSKGESAFLFINMDEERFSRCFSKFEMVAALEFIQKASHETGIGIIGITASLTNSIELDGSYSSAHETKYDRSFLENFKRLSSHHDIDKINFPDAFLSSILVDQFMKNGIHRIYICGFDAEHQIMASTIGALRENLEPVILSDAISSRNERVYFECLDVLMKWCKVKDTRDLMKEWDIW